MEPEYFIFAGLVAAILTIVGCLKSKPMPESMEERPAYRPKAMGDRLKDRRPYVTVANEAESVTFSLSYIEIRPNEFNLEKRV